MPTDLPKLRIGHGYDVHVWSDAPDRPLVLGGVVFEGATGLRGHSDADAITHACIDALLSAAGLGDIGSWFPDTDPGLAGADSVELLRAVMAAVGRAGWIPVNVDCTVVLDTPRLAPHRAEMEQVLSEATGAPITIKGKTTEGMGGLGGGVQCYAVALVARDD